MSTNNDNEEMAMEEPKVGMTFKDRGEVYEFYKSYAKAKGFGIVKRGGKKDLNTGEERWITIACSKGRTHKAKGNNVLSQRSSGRIECKGRICCAKYLGMWIITKVELEHNHEVNPELNRFIRQHRVVDEYSKRQLELNDKAGIRPTDNVKSVISHAGGHEELSCLRVDLTNHVNKIRRLHIVGGDAEAVHRMFWEMQTESQDFVSSIKPDKEGRMKHIFWADGRCRAAYREFSDVITFDTTYLVNKYDMPCGAFVGVNHHGHSILLGCALVNNEKFETYKWLFEQWLKCMDGKPPDAIITDQCPAICEAVKIVFPVSRHRWCLWHILCKFPQKFPKNEEYGRLKDTFLDVVYDSRNSEEFEECWKTMVSDYKLETNYWLAYLYVNRQQWAPVYVKGHFWAGMSSTQRSESMHSFFNGYVHSRSSLIQFVEQYQIAVRDKVEKEVKEDYFSEHTQVPCVTRFPFEMQLQKAYTNNMFRLVQKQMTDVMYCDAKLQTESGSKRVYEVHEMVKVGGEVARRKRFEVQFDMESKVVKCDCKLFDFKGILCCHAFKVLVYNEVFVLTDMYILRRWRKDVGRCHRSVKVGGNNMSVKDRRTKELEKLFYVAVDVAIGDGSKYEYMVKGLNEHIHTLENWQSISDERGGVDTGTNYVHNEELNVVDHTSCAIKFKDPVSVKRRGRPRTKRVVGMMEKKNRQKAVTRTKKWLKTPSTQNTKPSGATDTTLQVMDSHGQLPPAQSMAVRNGCTTSQLTQMMQFGADHTYSPQLTFPPIYFIHAEGNAFPSPGPSSSHTNFAATFPIQSLMGVDQTAFPRHPQ